MNPLHPISVPYGDLYSPYLDLQEEIDQAISETIQNSDFIRGNAVECFEADFAQLVGSKECISCANGTDALFIALKSLGVKSGDEVIVPAQSWISTSEIVTLAGAKVVFCDTRLDTFTIDPSKIEHKITDRTVGIIPVHLYGQAADMNEILDLAKRYGLWIVEDCAQAHLATYDSKHVGSFGDIATYSFYPGKNLGAMGDAGAITTQRDDLAVYMRMFARHGGLKKGDHQIEGMNSRLDGLQASILNVKLKYIDEWTNKRRKIASMYLEQLKYVPCITLPRVLNGRTHSWHLFTIKSQQRERLIHGLQQAGISTLINYPTPLPLVPAYSYLGHDPSDFPNAVKNCKELFSIPLYPEMQVEQVNYVIDVIKNLLQ